MLFNLNRSAICTFTRSCFVLQFKRDFFLQRGVRKLLSRYLDKSEQSLFKQDNLDQSKWILVYNTGSKQFKIKCMKVLLPFVFYLNAHIVYSSWHLFASMFKFNNENEEDDISIFETSVLPFLAMSLFSTIAVFFVTLRYVNRIYYNQQQQTFRFVTEKFLFLNNRFDCKAGRAVNLPNKNIIDHVRGGLLLQDSKKRLLIADEYFTSPLYYNLMYGYTSARKLR